MIPEADRKGPPCGPWRLILMVLMIIARFLGFRALGLEERFMELSGHHGRDVCRRRFVSSRPRGAEEACRWSK